MAVLRWIAGFVVTVCVAVFAVFNSAWVSVTWSPLHDSVMLPLYAVALGALAFGFVFGVCVTWLNMGRLRKEKRLYKRSAKRLEKEVGRLKEDQSSDSLPVLDVLPAVSVK